MSSVAQSTDFVDLTTIITAEWLNAVDAVIFDLMGGPQTITEFAAAIGGPFEGLHNLGAPSTAGLAIVSTGPNSFAYYPVLDEDDMASDRADAICTQQSIKAYCQVDLSIAGFLDEDDMASDSDTKVASQQSIKAYADDLKSQIGAWVLGTVVDTTTGTTAAWTSLPSAPPVACIMLGMQNVSVDGAHNIHLQLGDATTGGYVTSGYRAACSNISSSATTASSTTGAILINSDAANEWNGIIMITCIDTTNFLYSISFVLGDKDNSQTLIGGSSCTLAGLVDRVRLITSGGDAFDTGKANITYCQ